jgi:nucleoside-diphosphate kinase
MSNYTFVMLKPDCFQNGHVGDVIKTLETCELSIWASRIIQLSRTHCEKLYAEHIGQVHYVPNVEYIMSGRCMPMIVVGGHDKVVQQVRLIVGDTNPANAEPGTIRGQYGIGLPQNTIHAAATPDNAYREMSIFFMPYDVPPGGPVPSDLPYEQIE